MWRSALDGAAIALPDACKNTYYYRCASRQAWSKLNEINTRDCWVDEAALAAALACVEINHWFGGSPPNFRTLYLGQIDVDSADFWTNRLLSSSSRGTAESLASKRSHTRTLKSG